MLLELKVQLKVTAPIGLNSLLDMWQGFGAGACWLRPFSSASEPELTIKVGAEAEISVRKEPEPELAKGRSRSHNYIPQ